MAAAAFFALCNLYAVGWSLSYQRDAHGLFVMAVIMVGLAIPIFVVASSGLSIARDKELGTWNGLRLSAIRSGEIARAKLAAPIIAALGYSLVLLPTALFVFGVDYLICRASRATPTAGAPTRRSR
jgi:ABC-type Na+ efflux pump permease subunit